MKVKIRDKLKPCWWFSDCETYEDVRWIVEKSTYLTDNQIVACLRDAYVRARVFKPSLCKSIRILIKKWDKFAFEGAVPECPTEANWQPREPNFTVIKPKPSEPEPTYPQGDFEYFTAVKGYYGEFPKVNLHLSEEDVWAGGSTWWHQAAKIREQVKYGNPHQRIA